MRSNPGAFLVLRLVLISSATSLGITTSPIHKYQTLWVQEICDHLWVDYGLTNTILKIICKREIWSMWFCTPCLSALEGIVICYGRDSSVQWQAEWYWLDSRAVHKMSLFSTAPRWGLRPTLTPILPVQPGLSEDKTAGAWSWLHLHLVSMTRLPLITLQLRSAVEIFRPNGSCE
jgi:hypothetical protein